MEPTSPLLKSVLLPLVKQISLRRSQVYDLRAAVPVFLHLRALLTEVGVGDPGSPTDGALPLIAPEIAFIADLHDRAGADVGIADHALAIALFAQTPNGDSRLLSAHDEVWVMLSHENPMGDKLLRFKLYDDG